MVADPGISLVVVVCLVVIQKHMNVLKVKVLVDAQVI